MLPIYLSTPDMLFPRMKNVSFWFSFFAFAFMVLGFKFGRGNGWTQYPPLSLPRGESRKGLGTDFTVAALHLAGIGTILSSIKYLTTISYALTVLENKSMKLFV